jgi:hypothetical protein
MGLGRPIHRDENRTRRAIFECRPEQEPTPKGCNQTNRAPP